MKLGVTCLLWLLLICLTLPATHGRVLQRSMEIRNPEIDPSWYTGRGIRPVGRFGRRQALAGDPHPGCSAPHLHPHAPQQELNP
ncbi:prolactin-releasing peptide [Poecile atricapillus]|uniref:prolactin-releasing peptide n=1 Tax=Poecile atricapillus TaxID=48891 RepID=UPI00273994AE|nr:prolactin-releasing peptide [Poecile atricapillus]